MIWNPNIEAIATSYFLELLLSVSTLLTYSFSSPGKRGADGRLSSAQTALMLQEETIRRLERERKVLNDKLMTLETGVAQVEADKRALREKVTKSQKNEARGEKERDAMRTQIDNAESRVTRMDLKRKSLEGLNILLFS